MKIESLIQRHNLVDRVELLGAVKDIGSLYQEAHLFCLPSRWEGFPNALGEALSYGLPSVGYQECGGVCDLIVEGVNGLLAQGNGNSKTLEIALRSLMANDKKRIKMAQSAVKSVAQYDPERIYNLWDSFLTKRKNL